MITKVMGRTWSGAGADLERRLDGFVKTRRGEMERSLGRIGGFSGRGRQLGVEVKVEDAVAVMGKFRDGGGGREWWAKATELD